MPSENAHIRNFCIIAHIDHGKSTLADRLLEKTGTVNERQKQAQFLDNMDLERERGITIKAQAVRMNYRAQDGKDYVLNLIDTPGHVDFAYEVSRSLAACEGALLVVDATQGVEAQTLANVYMAIEHNLEIIPVINKIDLPSADVERTRAEIEDVIGLDGSLAVPVSAKEGVNIDQLLEAVVRQVPPPSGTKDAPLKALVFDSWYDNYRGVVMLVRLLEGTVSVGQKIKLWSNNKEFEVQELGVIAPFPTAVKSLMAGEVGIFVANVKELADAKVGDTITDAARPTDAPFPGFKEVKPMVFSGVFPVDAADYDNLRDALTKLRLNDSAFTFEPETSTALGFGFRCGYLGLLHMEIVQERLEREYNLNLISTAPSVVYKVFPHGGEPLLIDNPAKLPPVQNIEHLEEPYLVCHIHVPNDHLGAILKLCQERRGIQKAIDWHALPRDVRDAAGRGGVRLLRQDEVGEPRVRLARLRARRVQDVRPGEARHPHQRRGGRRPVDHRAPGARVPARPRGLREAQAGDPQTDVRGRDPGGDRQSGDQPRDRVGDEEERAGQVLRRRHLTQAQAAREAEGGQAAHEAGRRRRYPPGSLPRGPQDGGVTWPTSRWRRRCARGSRRPSARSSRSGAGTIAW
jgi:GTP-binding protein LepA